MLRERSGIFRNNIGAIWRIPMQANQAWEEWGCWGGSCGLSRGCSGRGGQLEVTASCPLFFTTAKERCARMPGSPWDSTAGHQNPCYYNAGFPSSSSCETTVAFTRVGCSHDIGHHKRLNAEASVRTHLPAKKPDIKGICKCCIMPLVTQNPFFGGCICGIVPRPGIKSWLMPQLRSCQILNPLQRAEDQTRTSAVTQAAAIGSLTHRTMAGIPKIIFENVFLIKMLFV